MKKLYLIVDEWDNDKNFVGSELELIKKQFDVTVICNGRRNAALIDNAYPADIKFIEYYRKIGFKLFLHFIKCLTDKTFYEELSFSRAETSRELTHNVKKIAKISEIIRFYVNAELFFDFLKQNDCIETDAGAIYYTYWYFWKSFALSKHKRRLKNAMLITRVHGYDLYLEQIPTFYQPFKRFMDERLDKICFIAEFGLQYYLSTFNIANSNKHILYKLGTKDNGIAPYEKTSIIRVVSCSSITELKRVHLIVDAISCISDKHIEWIHFGDGVQMADIELLANKKLGHKHNIKHNFYGRVSNDVIMKYYSSNSVDAFIMTSKSEGNPVSVIEAMSFGIPVIATNICNMPNLVKGNGILISENPEPVELADAICDFANMDEASVMSMRNMSRKIWEDEYRADVNNKAFVDDVLLKL